MEVGGGGVGRLREVRKRGRGSQGEEVGEWDKEKEGYRESRIPQVHKLVHLVIHKFPIPKMIHAHSSKLWNRCSTHFQRQSRLAVQGCCRHDTCSPSQSLSPLDERFKRRFHVKEASLIEPQRRLAVSIVK